MELIRRITLQLIILSSFLIYNPCLLAKDQASLEEINAKISAELKFKRGEVLFRTSDSPFEVLEVGQDLFERDVIKTEKDSFALIELPDSSKIKIGPETEIQINKLVAQINNENFEKTSIILRTGKILIDIINKAAEPVFEIKTRNASIAVRGTQFFVSDDQKENGNLWVASNRGELEVKSDRIRGMEEAIDGGQGLVIDQLGGFTQPLEYNWVKTINYDTQHRTQAFGEFGSGKAERLGEFKNKKRAWQQNPERFNKRKEKWKELSRRYEKKSQKFKGYRKRYRKIKEIFKERRKGFFKKRKTIINKIRNLKRRLDSTSRVDRKKRKLIKEELIRAKQEAQNLTQEKRDYKSQFKDEKKQLNKSLRMNHLKERRQKRKRKR